MIKIVLLISNPTKMKHLLTIAIICISLLTSNSAKAQQYETGIGVRLGGISQGITLKHFIGGNDALEGILSFGHHAFFITGLYENHHAFPNAEGLSWFWGGGAHVGFFTNGYDYDYIYYKYRGNHIIVHDDDYDGSSFLFGGDFILGMEYKLQTAPVAFSLDVKPQIDFVPGLYAYWDGALTVRFTF
jgi:hypothetical protein